MKYKEILLVITLTIIPLVAYNQKKEMNLEEHIYHLPFEKGKRILLMQGYNGTFSHKNKYALDFRLRKGRKIYAARGGVVSKVVQHNNEGGANKKYLSKGNHVIVNHGDGTYGAYWHLILNGSLVKKGDTVAMGEPIAKAGSTGYSSMSHLHFMVFKYDKHGHRITMPTKFYTSKGIKELKSYRSYRH